MRVKDASVPSAWLNSISPTCAAFVAANDADYAEIRTPLQPRRRQAARLL